MHDANWLSIVLIHLSEKNGQITTVPVELLTTEYFPCRCLICPESTALVQWYRSSNSDAFIKDGKAIAWWSEGATGTSQGFGIKNDFSMIIYNLTDQHNNKFYRCIVSPVGGAAACTHDIKLSIYGKYLFMLFRFNSKIALKFAAKTPRQ